MNAIIERLNQSRKPLAGVIAGVMGLLGAHAAELEAHIGTAGVALVALVVAQLAVWWFPNLMDGVNVHDLAQSALEGESDREATFAAEWAETAGLVRMMASDSGIRRASVDAPPAEVAGDGGVG